MRTSASRTPFSNREKVFKEVLTTTPRYTPATWRSLLHISHLEISWLKGEELLPPFNTSAQQCTHNSLLEFHNTAETNLRLWKRLLRPREKKKEIKHLKLLALNTQVLFTYLHPGGSYSDAFSRSASLWPKLLVISTTRWSSRISSLWQIQNEQMRQESSSYLNLRICLRCSSGHVRKVPHSLSIQKARDQPFAFNRTTKSECNLICLSSLQGTPHSVANSLFIARSFTSYFPGYVKLKTIS